MWIFYDELKISSNRFLCYNSSQICALVRFFRWTDAALGDGSGDPVSSASTASFVETRRGGRNSTAAPFPIFVDEKPTASVSRDKVQSCNYSILASLLFFIGGRGRFRAMWGARGREKCRRDMKYQV